MQQRTSNVEALFQTPEQKANGTITFRVYLDNAWRNIEGQASWKALTPKDLSASIEQAYDAQKTQ